MQRTFAWASAGAAAVFLAGGVAATIWGADRANAFNSESSCGGGGQPAYCSSDQSQVSTAQVLEAIGYSAAGLSALASAVLFLTLPRTPGAARQASAWCLPTAGGIACSGTY